MKNYPRSPYASPQRGHFLLRLRQSGIQPDRDVQVSAEVRYQTFKKDLSQRLRALLAEAQRAGLSRERFTVWVKGLLRDAYQQAFDLGLKAAGWTGKMEDADHLWLGSFQNTEERYLDGFISDLYENKGTMPKERRLQMYVDTLDSVFTAGKLAGQPDNIRIKWVMSEAEHCRECIDRALHSPYTKSSLPGVPKDGSTPCLTNCACHLEFEEPAPVRVDFPLRMAPSSLPIGQAIESARLRLSELQMLSPQQLQTLKHEAQLKLTGLPFPSRAYTLQLGALLMILLAFSHKDEQSDVALTQRYKDAGILPLGDLHHPTEVWSVVPVAGGWAARSSGSTLGVFPDWQDAYDVLVKVARQQGRVVPVS